MFCNKKILAVGGALVLPHLACVLTGGTAIGSGIHFLLHGISKSNNSILNREINKFPTEYKTFSQELTDSASMIVKSLEPSLKDEDLKFILSDNTIFLIVPSKRKIYDLGTLKPTTKEDYHGQHAITSTLTNTRFCGSTIPQFK